MSAAVIHEIDRQIATYCHRDLMAVGDVIDILLDIRTFIADEDFLALQEEPEPVLA